MTATETQPQIEIELLRERPAMDRLRLRIILSSLRMVQGQLRDMPPGLLAEVAQPALMRMLEDWEVHVAALYGMSRDTPPPARVTTTDNEPALPAA